MSIRDEDLIDYLLGEADDAVIRRVQLALQTDAQVAVRLEQLRAALGLLDSMKDAIDPPFGLAERTLSFIDSDASGAPLNSSQFDVNQDASASAGESNSPSPKVRLRSVDLLAREPRTSRRGWDSAFMTLSLTACVCLLLPLIVNGRSLSRQMQCAANLHLLSSGLIQLAMLEPERRFPEVPTSGVDSFPGMFALRLKDSDLLPAAQVLRCYRLPGNEPNTTQIVCFPTTQEFMNAPATEQAWLRKWLGGDYAYNYGIVVNGRIEGLPLDGSSHMALLGDAPEVKDGRDLFNGHEGRGINVCFADGHVALKAFTSTQRRQKLGGRSFVVVDEWEAVTIPFEIKLGVMPTA